MAVVAAPLHVVARRLGRRDGCDGFRSGTMGGGVGTATVEAGVRVRSNASNGVSGGGTAAAAVAGATSIAYRRLRNSAISFMAFRR